jgi:NADP-dependent aldehyde dehydrogenase
VASVVSIDPRTGETVDVVAEATSTEQVDRLCRAALDAAPMLDGLGRNRRAALLRQMADALESRREDIVAVADRETALGRGRLDPELTRSCYQLRLFAEVIEEGSYLEATIDHAADTPMGPRPDLRRMLVPIGPVAVFGASNFPLAFSVPGGDTTSALAAGCPVVVKAHSSHPATSQLCFDILAAAADLAGAPSGTLSIVYGQHAGGALVAHPAIRAVGFTGSLSGGRALQEIINKRPDPIPLYGELSSLNPLIVTPLAAEERAEDIGRGFVQSFTLGAGQFCTKPGLAFVPAGPSGDRLLAATRQALGDVGAQWLLNERIAASYEEGVKRLASLPMAESAVGGEPQGQGFQVQPRLVIIDAASLNEVATEECFGPVAVVARYRSEDELLESLTKVPTSLVTAVHTGEREAELPTRVADILQPKTGRVVYNGYPTGVAVSWAQHHGGPWPATNSLHTSVGTSAIRRFLRPVAWQNAPASALPPELRDEEQKIPRRIDGSLVLPVASSNTG